MANSAGFNWYWVGGGGNDLWNNYLNWRYDPGNGTRVLGASSRFPGSSYSIYSFDNAFIEQNASIDVPANNTSPFQLRSLTIGGGTGVNILVSINLTSTSGLTLNGDLTVLSNVNPNSTIRDDTFTSGVYTNVKNLSSTGLRFYTNPTYASPVLYTHNISASRIVLKTKVTISSANSTYVSTVNLLEDLTLDCYSQVEFGNYFTLNLNGYGFTMGRLYWNSIGYAASNAINFTPRANNYSTGKNNLSYIRITGTDGDDPYVYYPGANANYRLTLKIYSDGTYNTVAQGNNSVDKYQRIVGTGQRPIVIFDCDPLLQNYSYSRTIQGFIEATFVTSASTLRPQADIVQSAKNCLFDYYIINGQTGDNAFTYLHKNFIYGTIDFTGNVPGDNTPKGPGCPHPLGLENYYTYGYVFLGHFILNQNQELWLGNFNAYVGIYDYTSGPIAQLTRETGPNLWFMHDRPAKNIIDSASSTKVLRPGEIGYLYNTNTIKIGDQGGSVNSASVVYSDQYISKSGGSVTHGYSSNVLTFSLYGGGSAVNSQVITLDYNITVPGGSSVYWVLDYSISSESGYDFGYVTIAGIGSVSAVSGTSSGSRNGTLPNAGTYQISIKYTKDTGVTSGTDTFFGSIAFTTTNDGPPWANLGTATGKLASQWSTQNPTLASNAVAWETDTGKLKKGNGSTPFNSLSYQSYSVIQPQNDYANHPKDTAGLGDGWIIDFQSNSLINAASWDNPSSVSAGYYQFLVFQALAPNVKVYLVSDVCANCVAINMYDNSCTLFVYESIMWFVWEVQHVYGVVSTVYGGAIRSISAQDQDTFYPRNYDIVGYDIRSSTTYGRTIFYSMLGPGVLDLYRPNDIQIYGYGVTVSGINRWHPSLFEVCNMSGLNYLSGGDTTTPDGSATYLRFGTSGINSSLNTYYSAYHQERVSGGSADTIYKTSKPTIYFNFLAEDLTTGMIAVDTYRASTELDVYVYSLRGNFIDSTGENVNGNCFSILYTGGWNGWATGYSNPTTLNSLNTTYIKTRLKTVSNYTFPSDTSKNYFSTPKNFYSAWLWEDSNFNILSMPPITAFDQYLNVTDPVLVPLKLYQTISSTFDYSLYALGIANTSDLRYQSGGPVSVEIANDNGYYNNYQIISVNSQGKVYFNITDIADNSQLLFINNGNGILNLAGLNMPIQTYFGSSDDLNIKLYGWSYSSSYTGEYSYSPFNSLNISDIESGHFISKTKNFNFRYWFNTLILSGGQLRLPAFLNVRQGVTLGTVPTINYFTNIEIQGGYQVINSNVVGQKLFLKAGVLDQSLLPDYYDTGYLSPVFNTVDFTINNYYRKFIHGYDAYAGNALVAFNISTSIINGNLAWLASGDKLSITTLGYSGNQYIPSLITFTGQFSTGENGSIRLWPGNLDNLGSQVNTAIPAVIPDTYFTYPPDQNALEFDLSGLPSACEVAIGDPTVNSISTACVQTIHFGYNSWLGFGQNYASPNDNKLINFYQDLIFCGNSASPWGTGQVSTDGGGLVTPPNTRLEAYTAATTLYFQGNGDIQLSKSNIPSSIFPNVNVGDAKYQYVIQANQLGLPNAGNLVVNYVNKYFGALSYYPYTSDYTIFGGDYGNLNLLGGYINIRTGNNYTATTAVNVTIKDTIGTIAKGGETQVYIIYDGILRTSQNFLTYRRYSTSTELLAGEGNLLFANGTQFNANLDTYGNLGIGAYRTVSTVVPTVTINPCNSNGDGSPSVNQISTATFGTLYSPGEGPAIFKFRRGSTSSFINFTYNDIAAPRDLANDWYAYANTTSNTILKSTDDGYQWYISIPTPHRGTHKNAVNATNISIKDSVALNEYIWFLPGTVNSKFAKLHGTPGYSFREGYTGYQSYYKGAILPYFNWDLGNNSGWVYHALPSDTMDQYFWPNVPYDFGSLDLVDFYHQSWGDATYTNPGTYTWTVPANVKSVSITAIGGGGGGAQGYIFNSGGKGGNLVAINTVTVTPGETYTITVGSGGLVNNGGGTSSVVKTSNGTKILEAYGGWGGQGSNNANTQLPSSFADQTPQGDVFGYGGIMGIRGNGLGSGQNTAGGGAGGYGGDPNNRRVETGWGGNGLTIGADTDFASQRPNGNTSTIGGGGGGYANDTVAYGGGGTGIFGQTNNGLGGTATSPQGGGGSGGTSATGKNGGLYGGGGGGSYTGAGTGGSGAVRITWPGYSNVPK